MAEVSVESENRKIYFQGQEKAALEMDDNRHKKLKEWMGKYSLPHEGRVLDIGCWNGDFLRLLPEAWRKTGLDLSHHPNLPGEVRFVESAATGTLPFREAAFDLVFAGEIIEHLLHTSNFLQECQRVLRPGGLLMLTTPNLGCWLNLRQWWRLDQPLYVDCDADGCGHVRYLAPRVLSGKLFHLGFQILELSSVGGLERLLRFPRLYAWLFRSFPLRGKCLMCLARKQL